MEVKEGMARPEVPQISVADNPSASGERANIRVPVEVTSLVTEWSIDDVRWIEELKEKCERAFKGLPWLSKLPDEKRDPKFRTLMSEEEFSQPKVVTIGPFHRDERMPIADEEKCLIVYLMNHLYDLDLADYLKKKEKQVADALAFYSNSDISSHSKDDNKFAEMLLLDSYFILFMLTYISEILSKVTYDGVMLSRLDSSKGPKIMLGPEVMAKVADMLSHKDKVMLDLLILDNQIPFFVIEEQFKELKLKKPLHKYALEFFETIHPRSTQVRKGQNINPPNCEHLLHLFHWSRVPENKRKALISWRHKLNDVYWGCNTPNLTQLIRKSAIVFEKKTSGSSLDITFRRSRLVPVVGVIDIPRLHIHDYSSHIFHNLIAFEMQRPSSDHRTMAFVVIMRNLLHSEEDVKLLRQRGILTNAFMADNKLVDFFKSLSRLTENYQMPIDVYVFCRQVLSYHKRRMSGTCANDILKCFSSW